MVSNMCITTFAVGIQIVGHRVYHPRQVRLGERSLSPVEESSRARSAALFVRVVDRARVSAIRVEGELIAASALREIVDVQRIPDGTPFISDSAAGFYADWEAGANSIIASLRVEAGRTRTTRTSPPSSVNSSLVATSSAHSEQRTTSASTAREPNESTTPTSATSSSTTKHSNCPQTPVS